MEKSFHVVTGVTSGMGRQIASELSRRSNSHIVVGARHPEMVTSLNSLFPKEQLTVIELDLGLLTSTASFAERVLEIVGGGSIDSIICNAGLQVIGPKQITSEGYETTFVVNHLAHHLLVRKLHQALKQNASVVTVGSGTHNPDDPIGGRFGFRGATIPTNFSDLAAGDLGTKGTDVLLGMDRYATSKICAILSARGLALEPNPKSIGFYCFDPGLMPGTRLARQRSGIQSFSWKYILPLIGPLLPGVSSARKSARALVKECIDAKSYPSGSYIEYTRRLAPHSKDASDLQLARSLVNLSDQLVSSHL